MISKPVSTENGFRLTPVKMGDEKAFNWFFLPGGPGFGSQAIADLADQLTLPGQVFLVDYPNDGNNQLKEKVDFNDWHNGLCQLVQGYKNVILVAHSFSGMLALSEPRLENMIKGLVLLNTSPSNRWMEMIADQADKYQLPDISEKQAWYLAEPSNSRFKTTCLAAAPYFFTSAELQAGKVLLEKLPYSHESYDWVNRDFHPSYTARWIPKQLSTLIICSEFDYLTPASLFTEDKQWQRDNIHIELIKSAGHFPWLGEGLSGVVDSFNAFLGGFKQDLS